MLVQLCSEARARTDCHKLRISTGQVTVRQAPRQQQPQTQQPPTKPKPQPKPKTLAQQAEESSDRAKAEALLLQFAKRSQNIADSCRVWSIFGSISTSPPPRLRHDAHVVQSRSTWLDFYANTLRRGPIRKAANTPRETNLRTYRKHTENIPQNIKRRLQFSINNSQLVQLPRNLYIFFILLYTFILGV